MAILNTITPKVLLAAKYSSTVVKGGQKKKNKFIKNMVLDFVHDLQQKPESINVDEFQKMVDTKIPNKQIDIVGTKKNWLSDSSGHVSHEMDSKTNDVVGLHLYADTTNGKFERKDFPTLIHEFTHVLDFLTSPKKSARIIKMNEKTDKEYNKFFKFYKNNIYNNYDSFRIIPISPEKYLKNTEKKTRKFLDKFSPEEALDYIQMARYSAQSEKLAYNEGNFSKRKLKDLTLIDYQEFAWSKHFFFGEKAQMLKKIGFEKIKEIRDAHKASLQNSSK